jgi:large subunit ribosomal protein L6
MARFGKLPISLAEGVSVEVSPDKIKITGPRGSLEKGLPRQIKIEKKDDTLFVQKSGSSPAADALQGTYRSHLLNMVAGVTEGHKRVLEIVGPEYRAELRGNDLVLNLGFTNPVVFTPPEGIKFSLEKAVITIEGNDLEQVSQLAAKIRAVRPPDSYKGKGVRYQGEIVRKKPGKQAAKTEGA